MNRIAVAQELVKVAKSLVGDSVADYIYNLMSSIEVYKGEDWDGKFRVVHDSGDNESSFTTWRWTWRWADSPVDVDKSEARLKRWVSETFQGRFGGVPGQPFQHISSRLVKVKPDGLEIETYCRAGMDI